jgi:hypothetical protein
LVDVMRWLQGVFRNFYSASGIIFDVVQCGEWPWILAGDSSVALQIPSHPAVEDPGTGCGSNHGKHIPFGPCECEEGGDDNKDAKGVRGFAIGENDMDSKPNGEVENDSGDGGSDGCEGGTQACVSPELLNVGSAQKNPEEAGNEGGPCGDEGA